MNAEALDRTMQRAAACFPDAAQAAATILYNTLLPPTPSDVGANNRLDAWDYWTITMWASFAKDGQRTEFWRLVEECIRPPHTNAEQDEFVKQRLQSIAQSMRTDP